MHDELDIRDCARRLSLWVRRRPGIGSALYERDGPRRKVGEYRTWVKTARAIRRYGEACGKRKRPALKPGENL